MLDMLKPAGMVKRQYYDGKTCVVTGGASGMGRYLCVLAAQYGVRHLATCDKNPKELEETKRMCKARAKYPDICITTHVVDVSSSKAVEEFAEQYRTLHSDRLHLLFCNAGLAAGNRFADTPREHWDLVINVDLYGVVNCCRAFLPFVQRAKPDRAAIVNTSSINGFVACLGRHRPNNPYVTAKYAVTGFTESLMVELWTSDPHITVSCVHPGHIGTNIAAAAVEAKMIQPTEKEVRLIKMVKKGASDDEARKEMGSVFRENAPTTAEEAAEIILGGVARGSTRILVGLDAYYLDLSRRLFPRLVYWRPLELAFALFEVFHRIFVSLFWRKPKRGAVVVLAIAVVLGYVLRQHRL